MSCHIERRSAFEQENEVMPVFHNIFEIFKSPFVELEQPAEKPMLLLTETYILFFVSRKQMLLC